jgi:ferrous iron transport protein A
MMTLDTLKPNTSARILSIEAEDALARKLLEIGLLEGMTLHIAHRAPMGGDPMIIHLDHRIIALRRADAACVAVEPLHIF